MAISSIKIVRGLVTTSVIVAASFPAIGSESAARTESSDNKTLVSSSAGEQPSKKKPAEKKKYYKPSRAEIKRKLTRIQFKVTQRDGTETAFKNPYWNNKKPGIYVDIVTGEPLFSSLDKFKSGTGWPSFTKPLVPEHIVTRKDRGFFTTRIEVRSKHGDSHLGHVFNDGPAPTGLRYCLNSAALRFIPQKDLEAEGYGEFAKLFKLDKPAKK